MSIAALIAILGLNRVPGKVQAARSPASDRQATASCWLPARLCRGPRNVPNPQ